MTKKQSFLSRVISGIFGQRKYQGAITDRFTSDWLPSSTSSDAEIFQSLTELRNRSRQLIRDNPYAANAQSIVVDNVVGNGIRMQATVAGNDGVLDDPLNDKIENAWSRWCEKGSCEVSGRLNMTALLRLAMGGVFSDGEFLIRVVKKPFGESRIPFSLELIEPDYLVNNDSRINVGGNNLCRMGIEVDQWQRPRAYWLYKDHPGDIFYSGWNGSEYRRVSADEIFHLYVVNRWPQTRGVPWLHAVMRRLRDLQTYNDSEVAAARASANVVGFITNETGLGWGSDVEDRGPAASRRYRESSLLDRAGTLLRLFPGETFSGFAPQRPNASLDPFMRYMIREVAAGVGVSYESLSRDYSQSNYSSSRLSLLDDRSRWRVIQGWLISSYLTPIYRKWLDMAVLSGEIQIPDYFQNKEKYQSVRFMPRGWSWVDPTKEVQAYALAVQNGFTTLSDVLAESGSGTDLEDFISTKVRERELLKKAGLKFPLPSSQVSLASKQSESKGSDSDEKVKGSEGKEGEDIDKGDKDA